METDGNFYLGRVVDPEKPAAEQTEALLYDPDDLTTHAVVVGMTGSGKTGLCVNLLEEAALNHVPALMIDPKGDITNLLLHFPELLPQDFQPWLDPDQVRRAGQTLVQAATETADRWRSGLADWDIQPERIKALKDAARFAVYTPGSDAGIPVSILASLAAPDLPWKGNQEALREKISGTVTALLGLVGLDDIDPVRSREHILLSNIFENAWSQGLDLDLGELILQTQNPPFQKLGVFDVNTFFPEKDRFGLAMLLNNILAAPAFQTWIQGQPLDIPSLLYTPDGKPRHSVFYVAHLSDSERMFFVTLLFSAVEAWMRAQKGSGSLRALVYFDEIYGYLPPVRNPPSKMPMLRMLKQARAFGVGLLLATQNPADLDYKALANAGTWLVGKLQTEKDKQRLLDGLEGALGGNMDRGEYDRLLSSLGKRVFLLHNVHSKGPRLFQTRWAMNYLAGPLTRAQIPALNELAAPPAPPPTSPAELDAAFDADTLVAATAAAAAAPAEVSGAAAVPVAAAAAAALTQPAGAQAKTAPLAKPAAPAQPAALQPADLRTQKPSPPAGLAEYFLPANRPLLDALQADAPQGQGLGLVYRPALLVQAHVRFLNRKYNLDHLQTWAALVAQAEPRGLVRWEAFLANSLDPAGLQSGPPALARFGALQPPFSDGKALNTMQKDFLEWIYRTATVTVRVNEPLGVYAGPSVSQADFRRMCSEAARTRRDPELQKIQQAYEKKIAPLQQKLDAEKAELAEDENDLNWRRMEEGGQHLLTAIGIFGRGRDKRIRASQAKRRQTQRTEKEVAASRQTIDKLTEQIYALQQEQDRALGETNQRWIDAANQAAETALRPLKKDVIPDLFGLAWLPCHLVQNGDEILELPAYRA